MCLIAFMFAPSCLCCGCPTYTASGGNEFSDDFSSGVGSWTAYPTDTWGTSGGRARLTFGTGATWHGIYRTTSTLPTTPDVILEAEAWQLDSNTVRSALWFQATPYLGLFTGALFSIQARWDTGVYETYSPGGSISNTAGSPSGGDKLTIRIKPKGASAHRGCYYINETLVASWAGNWTRGASTVNYGLSNYTNNSAGERDLGEWDNFSMNIDS